jgi:hypothetical protein
MTSRGGAMQPFLMRNPCHFEGSRDARHKLQLSQRLMVVGHQRRVGVRTKYIAAENFG